MCLLKTIQQGEATPEVEIAYQQMIKRTGMVPKPVELASVSPFFFETLMKTIAYFSNHPNLDFLLLVYIRMLSSKKCANDICMNFNKEILRKMGLTDSQIFKIIQTPESAQLPPKEKAMLLFVLKAVGDPESVDETHINTLHKFGWEDRDIYDAVTTGVNMFALNKMMKIFKI